MKFSVIVPTWNAEKTIETCLDSIYGQSSVPDEVIVIDGGSTDATLSIAKKYLRPQDSVSSESDKGPYDAMNKGVAKAQGEIVAILNADDYWMPGTCESVREAFADSSANTGIVHGNLNYIRAGGTSDVIRPAHGLYNYYCIGMPTCHPATFVRKKVYDDVGRYDYESYPMCADQDFVYRVLEHGYQLIYLEKALSSMRAGGLSSRISYSNEIDLMLSRLPQPRKFFANTLNRLLGHQHGYYSGGFRDSWPKEIAMAVLTLGGAPAKIITAITMRLALRTRMRQVARAIRSTFK